MFVRYNYSAHTKMPGAADYQKGFDVQVGQVYANYRLAEVKIGHVQEKLWNEYSYPTTLNFSWQGPGKADEKAMMAMFEAFRERIDTIKIIRSDSGRPYKCMFQYPATQPPGYRAAADFSTVMLQYHGYAKRIGEAEAKAILAGKQGW